MTRGFVFWFLMLLCLLAYFIHFWPLTPLAFGGSVLFFICIGLIGWQVFGPPIRG